MVTLMREMSQFDHARDESKSAHTVNLGFPILTRGVVMLALLLVLLLLLLLARE